MTGHLRIGKMLTMSDKGEQFADAISDEVRERQASIRFNTIASLDKLTRNRVRWVIRMVDGKPYVMAPLYEVWSEVVHKR
jgi:hypothetical protein